MRTQGILPMIVGFLAFGFLFSIASAGLLLKEQSSLKARFIALNGELQAAKIKREEWESAKDSMVAYVQLEQRAAEAREGEESVEQKVMKHVSDIAKSNALSALEKKRKYGQLDQNFAEIAQRFNRLGVEWQPAKDRIAGAPED